MSEHDAAIYLGLSVRTLQDWRRRGVCLAYSKLGTAARSRIVYARSTLDAFLAAGRVEPKAA